MVFIQFMMGFEKWKGVQIGLGLIGCPRNVGISFFPALLTLAAVCHGRHCHGPTLSPYLLADAHTYIIYINRHTMYVCLCMYLCKRICIHVHLAYTHQFHE